ncbi:hypothetical protein Abr02nite_69210 [Paractinoplanes brasiliensis]|nr:hypothetical protein Abr02nite_69210 [Actinoplanes brasiliensis]
MNACRERMALRADPAVARHYAGGQHQVRLDGLSEMSAGRRGSAQPDQPPTDPKELAGADGGERSAPGFPSLDRRDVNTQSLREFLLGQRGRLPGKAHYGARYEARCA